jgi:hypothetical protein
MQSLGVLFGESLSIFEQLVRSKHPALQQADSQSCPINQTALYQCLFQETFEAHDAFEDVKALRKMLFHSNLQLSEEFIVNHCKGGFPVLARSSSQLVASACMSTFIQSQCKTVNFN